MEAAVEKRWSVTVSDLYYTGLPDTRYALQTLLFFFFFFYAGTTVFPAGSVWNGGLTEEEMSKNHR